MRRALIHPVSFEFFFLGGGVEQAYNEKKTCLIVL